MWKIGRMVIRRNGFRPVISVPNPWYDRLSKSRRVLLVIDVALSIVGIIATALGIPFGLPLLGGAIGLLVFIQVVQLKVIQMPPIKLELQTPEPSIQLKCGECGTEVSGNANHCPNCGTEFESSTE